MDSLGETPAPATEAAIDAPSETVEINKHTKGEKEKEPLKISPSSI